MIKLKQREMKMKLLGMLLAMFAVAAMLAGCGDSQVDSVKNGILEFDKSRTIEQAFSSKMDDLKWRKFTSDKNITVVEVVGTWTDDEMQKKIKDAQASIAKEKAAFESRREKLRPRLNELLRAKNDAFDEYWKVKSEIIEYEGDLDDGKKDEQLASRMSALQAQEQKTKARYDKIKNDYEAFKKKFDQIRPSEGVVTKVITLKSILQYTFALPMPGDKVLVQFIINADGTFRFAYGELQDKDGNVKENKHGQKAATDSVFTPEKLMEYIYK